MSDILHLRQALMSISTDYPFSVAFGRVKSRKQCTEGSIRLYNKLLRRQKAGSELHLDTISCVVFCDDHMLDQDAARWILQTFPTSATGCISLLEFVRGIDELYKRMVILLKSMVNATAIDRGYETVLNIIYFAVWGIVVLVVLGLDPLAFILGLSSIIVSFAFMIGPAMSSYFEVWCCLVHESVLTADLA